MLSVIWFFITAFAIALSMSWMIDHDGLVTVRWLDYQLDTSVTTAIFISSFLCLLIFSFSYVLARILSLKFPNLFRIFFKKTHEKRLESIIMRQNQALLLISKIIIAIEVKDLKTAEKLALELSKATKKPTIKHALQIKLSFEKGDFEEAIQHLKKLSEDGCLNAIHIKSLYNKAKLYLSSQQGDTSSAIGYAKQMLDVDHDNHEISHLLFKLYKEKGMWQEARKLATSYHSGEFSNELKQHEIVVLNSAIAYDYYKQKKPLNAIKYSRLALKIDSYFMPAHEILIKSLIRIKMDFVASKLSKDLYLSSPSLIASRLFDLVNRKKSVGTRIKLMKKMVASHENSYLSLLSLAFVHYNCKKYKEAIEYAQAAEQKNKSHEAHVIIARCQRSLKNLDQAAKHLAKSHMFKNDEYYFCNSCSHPTKSWSPKCPKCGSENGLEWRY